jgi:SAM-dependent methyltransferase
MGATTISMQRRAFDARFATRYFVGNGLDIGAGSDSLAQYEELFPLIHSVTDFDKDDGDAQALDGIADDAYDFVYSSHCLEHVAEPVYALKDWIRVTRPGGYLVISVPDEDLYEQGAWPSTFNSDHKHSFTICKSTSWSPASINVVDLLKAVSDLAQPISICTVDHAYRRELPRCDQTRTPLTEASIEFILRKYDANKNR